MKTYSRRELLKCFAAGGFLTAAGLWTPGQKMISIPKAAHRAATFFEFDKVAQTLRYVGPEDQYVPISELTDWLAKHNPFLLEDMGAQYGDHIVSLSKGYVMDKPEHLTDGTFIQDSAASVVDKSLGIKEVWQGHGASTDEDLYCDKQYMTLAELRHQRRMQEAAPHKGYKYPS